MARSVSHTGGGGFRPVSETVLLTRPALPPAHPRSALAAGTLLSDRFLVEEWIGRGGMGDVYRGRDLSTQSTVAIKVIARFEPEDTDRFMREASVLATLSHPAIVRYVAHGAAPSGNPFLVMAWLCGRDLSARLVEAPLTAEETWVLARRVCEALQVAHARGVVHRDLKPSNLILVDDDPASVTLLDFGVARSPSNAPLTRTGMVVGTVGYMAPEQALGEVDLDARADVFALGCLIYECLTGQPAFGGRHTVAVLAKMLSGEPPRLADREPRLAAFDPLLARLLAREKAARPRDAGEVLDALNDLSPLARKLRRITPVVTRAAVSERERKLVTVLLCRRADAKNLDLPAFTRIEGHARALLGPEPEIRRLSEHGLLIVLAARGVTTDRAVQAAQLACALRHVEPGLCTALATGLLQTGKRSVLGDVIDHAAELLHAAERGAGETIADGLTADLLRARFELSQLGEQWLVHEPRVLDATPRLLMGKQTPCVGREKELALLEATLLECKTDRVVRSVLVTAGPGMGKSRLSSELMLRVRAQHEARVLFAHGDAMAVGSTLSLVQQLILSGLGLRAGAPPQERWERCLACFGGNGATPPDPHALFLAELIGGAVDARHDLLLRAARNDPALMSEHKRRAFARFVGVLSQRSPLLIVIDDLHWGDLASVSYVDEALREAGDRAIMLCAFARPEVHEQFPSLWSGHERQDVRLPRLTARATERLVKSVLGDDAPRDTLARIVQLADGNAFYIEELLRQVAQGGRELPETLLAMAQARLEQLPASSRRVLRAASAFGERCWTSAVHALLGDGPDTSAELESLARHELLRRAEESSFPGEVEYRFRHALLREAAYAMLTEDDRRAAHRSAGAWLSARGESDSEVLAQHFELGGELQLAAAWLARAARAALDAGDIARVLSLTARGLGLSPSGSDRGVLLVLRAFGLMYAERADDALFHEALQLIPEGTEFWWMAISLAVWNAATAGQSAQAAPYIARAIHASTDAEPCGPQGHALFLSVIGLISIKQVELAESLIERFERTAQQRGEACDPLFIGWLKLARCTPGLTHPWSARELSDAIAHAERAREIMRKSGTVMGEVAAVVYGAIALRNIGGYAAAEQLLKHGELLLTPGIPRALHEILHLNRAWHALRAGRLAVAEPLVDRLVGSLDHHLALQALSLQAELHYRRGELQQALATARRCTTSEYPTAERWGGATLARTLLALGQPEEALVVARGALSGAGLGHEADTETDLYLSLALSQRALGDVAASVRTLEEVCARIQDTAASFDDPQQRELFLHGIENHARAAQLRASWS